VVPARNEASRLDATYAALRPLAGRPGGAEIVFVIDSSSSDETVAVGRRLAEESEHVRLEVVSSRGKGNAVGAGVATARGDVVLLADADLAVSPEQFGPLVDAGSSALAIASRSVRGALRRGEPASRYVAGRAFNAAVRALILPGVRDTQCGFKAFPRRPFAPVFASMQTEGWCFDVELIACARRLRIPVVELPVDWTYGHGSKVRVARDATTIARDLLRLRRRFGRIRAVP
jgi:glycosyltransferase involved in cell wall biosynthesis